MKKLPFVLLVAGALAQNAFIRVGIVVLVIEVEEIRPEVD